MSTIIIGAEPYRFLAEKYGIPGVITGFEPVDALQGIAMIMRQLHEGRAEIEIAYARRHAPGNPVAMAAIDEVFRDVHRALARGLGEIPGSRPASARSSRSSTPCAASSPDIEPTQDPEGLPLRRCPARHHGSQRVPLFRRVCTPENPVGPCMVSSEGSCAAYYRYY